MANLTKSHANLATEKSLMNRHEVMAILDCSMTQIIRLEASGMLTRKFAKKGERTIIVYDADQVARQAGRMGKRQLGTSARTPEGEIHAIAFEMFDKGASLREVLVRTREPIDKVQELREAWLDMGGSSITISDIAQREIARFVGPFTTISELVQRIADRFGAEIKIDERVAEKLPDESTLTDADLEQAIVAALDREHAPPAHAIPDVSVPDGVDDAVVEGAIQRALDHEAA